MNLKNLFILSSFFLGLASFSQTGHAKDAGYPAQEGYQAGATSEGYPAQQGSQDGATPEGYPAQKGKPAQQ